MARIAVIDIGKTNAKVLVVDLATGAEEVVARAPNAVVRDGPYPHHDAGALWDFVLEGLRGVGRIAAVSVTTHGASAALVDAGGGLALPILDYEHDGPDAVAAGYDAIRPVFAETGSPRLPGGLNLGAQLYWQARAFPDAFARVRHILTLPQYLSFRLSGVAASEWTSLGCHTDLWAPFAGRFSSLPARMDWTGLFPPVAGPGQVPGPVTAEVAAATGLAPGTPVLSGIHDSNASLVPWLGAGARGVISTGTWMIVMAIGGRQAAPDPARDVLVNVSAEGQPVPTARFMAGREVEEITGGRIVTPAEDDLRAVLAGGVMALPSRHPGTGPFPGLAFGWAGAEPQADGPRAAAAAFYAALMAAECLDLAGATGETVVEGPFGANAAFLRMLATVTGRPVVAAGAGAGTGLGAALLAGRLEVRRPLPPPVLPETDPLWTAYAAAWRARVAAAWGARRG